MYMAKTKKEALITEDEIINKIYVIRGHKIILDSDLAMLYDVETRVLNQSVKRNIDRFPPDFMFELTEMEWQKLKNEFGELNDWGGRRKLEKIRNNLDKQTKTFEIVFDNLDELNKKVHEVERNQNQNNRKRIGFKD